MTMADNQQVVFTSKVIHNERLFEQVYEPKRNLSYYVAWDEKINEPIPMNYIENGNIKYYPIVDDLLQKSCVILPSKPMEYENDDELELEIKSFIETWVDVSKEHQQKAVWYVFLTRLIDNINTIPYLRALGDYGTGKTRYLDVIGGLCYKPMFVGGSVRSAPIYRVIDLWRGTGIFDEFTLKQSDETQDIIQILNNGYQRGKPVLRCKDGNYDQVIAFDPFGPKVLASRTTWNDKALESRCVTEILKTTNRKNIPIDLTENFFKQRDELQNKLLMYRFKNWNTKKLDETIQIDFGNILPRIKQSLTPFTVLFQYDKDKLNQFVIYTREINKKTVLENSASFDGIIINSYLNLFEKHEQEQQFLDDYHEPALTSTDIKNYMVEHEGYNSDKLSASSIGKRLSSLGFEVMPKKIAGKTKKVITINDEIFNKLKQKYVVTAVTEVTGYTDEVKNKKLGEYYE